MSLFTPQTPQGIFAPCGDVAPYVALTFARPKETQNSAGEIITSLTTVGPITGSLQPRGGSFPRFLHGQLIQVDYDFYVPGAPDIRVGDRATVSGVLTEVVTANQYGADHTEVALKELR